MATLKELKIQVVKNYIQSCVPNSRSYNTYVYGKISSKVLNNARSYYANSISKEQVLGIIDTSFWGNGKSGIVFGEFGYSVSNCQTKYIEYPHTLGSSFTEYNIDIVNKISRKIYEIDERDRQDDEFAADIAKGIIKGGLNLLLGRFL